MVHYERTLKKNRCFCFTESHDDSPSYNQALAAQPTFGAQIETRIKSPFDLQIKDLHPQKTNMDIPKMMFWKRWLLLHMAFFGIYS